jgi:hypothetical protein
VSEDRDLKQVLQGRRQGQAVFLGPADKMKGMVVNGQRRPAGDETQLPPGQLVGRGLEASAAENVRMVLAASVAVSRCFSSQARLDLVEAVAEK